MTPLNLLTMGHTIKGLKGRGAYKMAKNGLPQFKAKNPAVQGAKAKSDAAARLVQPPHDNLVMISNDSEVVARTAPPPSLTSVNLEVETLAVLQAAPVSVSTLAASIPVDDSTLPASLDLPSDEPPVEPVAAAALEVFPASVSMPRPHRMSVDMDPTESSWSAPIALAEPSPEMAEMAEMTETPEPPSAGNEQKDHPVAPRPFAPSPRPAREPWWSRLVRKFSFRRPPPRLAGVQTELALERVAVVRNDLSDDDLEVRLRKVPTGRNPFKGVAAKSARASKAREKSAIAGPPIAEPAMAEAGGPDGLIE